MDISGTSQVDKFLSASQVDPRRDTKPVSQSDWKSEKLEDVAKKFEGLLLHQMFKQAQETTDQISDAGEDEEDAGTEQYKSLFWTEMADVVSEQGGLGLWKTINQQLQDRLSGQNAASGKLDENL